MILVLDATILRWFPPLHAAWAPRGAQARVAITGRNAKRTLWGAINIRTGHRVVGHSRRMRREDFQTFLRELRRRYAGRPLWVLLDRAPCHTALHSQELAARLGVVLLWLPKQCSELNGMDHLWRELKRRLAANRQYPTIDSEVTAGEVWLRSLSPTEALRKAGMLSKKFWLRQFRQNFCTPT